MSKPIDIADQFEVVPQYRDKVALLHVYDGCATAQRLYVYTVQIGGKPHLNTKWYSVDDEDTPFRRKSEWVPVHLHWNGAESRHAVSGYEYNERTGDVRRVEE